MSAPNQFPVSRLDEPVARLALDMLCRMDAAWATCPAGHEFSLAAVMPEWLEMLAVAQPPSAVIGGSAGISPVIPQPPEAAIPPVPAVAALPGISCPVHADLRLAALALAVDLIELRALYPAEPADWVSQLALDRRTRVSFTKPLA